MNNKFYLYVKQHRQTGLKYFGKTSTKDPYVYEGSGLYWRRHLKLHGKDIDTINVWEFDNIATCEKFALEFSVVNNIVESNEWANLRPENGKDGKVAGSPGMKKEMNPNWGKTKEQNSFYGKKHKPKTIELYKQQKAGGNNPRAKKVSTPIGEFECANYAAKALKISKDTLRERLRNKISGYSYI
jgi:hypothetical protein